MNDIRLALNRASALLEATKGDGLRVADGAGLYPAARFIVQDVHDYIDEHLAGNSYAREKASNYLGHVAAILGFDVANGHDASQHRSWGQGELSTLANLFERLGPS